MPLTPCQIQARNKIEKHDHLSRDNATQLVARLFAEECQALAEEIDPEVFREILRVAKLRLAEADAAALRGPAPAFEPLDFSGCRTPQEVFAHLAANPIGDDGTVGQALANGNAALARIRELTFAVPPELPSGLDVVEEAKHEAGLAAGITSEAALREKQTITPADVGAVEDVLGYDRAPE